MSALYQIRCEGIVGAGHAALYIGKGRVIGIDITGARYDGSYTEQGGVLSGSVTLTSVGGELVMGQRVPYGIRVPITFKLPSNFADGEYRTISMAGKPLQVSFQKIGDIP
jgi:hypothetical protein